jgi:hypothetical protein
MGWAGVKNGELLRRAENQFDLLLTADNRLRLPGRCSATSRQRPPGSFRILSIRGKGLYSRG